MTVSLNDYKSLKDSRNCIYKITSPSGKSYIGKTQRFYTRMWYYKKLKCKKQVHLYNSLTFYGLEKHIVEILEENIDILEIYKTEIYYISKFDSFKNGLNKTLGGEGIEKYSEEFSKQLYDLNKKGFNSMQLSKMFNLRTSTIHAQISKINTFIKHKPKLTFEHIEKLKEGARKTRLTYKKQYDIIPIEALDEKGNYRKVISKTFGEKLKHKSEWHINCVKLYNQNIHKKRKSKV